MPDPQVDGGSGWSWPGWGALRERETLRRPRSAGGITAFPPSAALATPSQRNGNEMAMNCSTPGISAYAIPHHTAPNDLVQCTPHCCAALSIAVHSRLNPLQHAKVSVLLVAAKSRLNF